MFTKARGVALGRIRGKCRWCDYSCQLSGGDWAAEDYYGDAYECPAAPQWPCRPCEGRGFHEVWERDERGQAQRVRQPCGNCAGAGWVPGPHWPWRHPEPTR